LLGEICNFERIREHHQNGGLKVDSKQLSHIDKASSIMLALMVLPLESQKQKCQSIEPFFAAELEQPLLGGLFGQFEKQEAGQTEFAGVGGEDRSGVCLGCESHRLELFELGFLLGVGLDEAPDLLEQGLVLHPQQLLQPGADTIAFEFLPKIEVGEKQGVLIRQHLANHQKLPLSIFVQNHHGIVLLILLGVLTIRIDKGEALVGTEGLEDLLFEEVQGVAAHDCQGPERLVPEGHLDGHWALVEDHLAHHSPFFGLHEVEQQLD
jgi:hypothetical protein